MNINWILLNNGRSIGGPEKRKKYSRNRIRLLFNKISTQEFRTTAKYYYVLLFWRWRICAVVRNKILQYAVRRSYSSRCPIEILLIVTHIPHSRAVELTINQLRYYHPFRATTNHGAIITKGSLDFNIAVQKRTFYL
jgi:hypothetical protein